MRLGRIAKAAVIIRPATLRKLHDKLKRRKYQRMFSSSGAHRRRPGPAGPSKELVDAIVQMKTRNPRFGSPRIAQQISLAFGIEIDKDVVRRVLAKHYRPSPADGGLSWLTVIGHMKDSLWSVDLFRCESIRLRPHWVMVVIDQFTRRIIGRFRDLPDSAAWAGQLCQLNPFEVVANVAPRVITGLFRPPHPMCPKPGIFFYILPLRSRASPLAIFNQTTSAPERSTGL